MQMNSDAYSTGSVALPTPPSERSRTPPTGQVLLETALQVLRASLRPGQQQMVDWQGGPLAVSAVPGAGKSTGMAAAVATAIARFQLHPRRQLVVVTFTRSAAASLRTKIRAELRKLSLPQGGFVVHTLHGLALTIATRYPELSGLNLDSVALVSPNQGHRLIRTCVERWMVDHPRRYRELIETEPFDGEETERLRRQSVLRTEILPALAKTVIHEAKSSGLLPTDLWQMADLLGNQSVDEFGVLAIAAGLYEHYQQLLQQRSLMDYDDMILGAIRVMADSSACQVLQSQVFAVFEDEAQDSTPLQTQLLERLATDPTNPARLPNLIRVGDPNQAINSTFTPADPIFFRWFCESCSTQHQLATIDQAGRSTQRIMEAANVTLTWVNRVFKAQTTEVSELPFREQMIRPVGHHDPQPNANPTAEGQGLEIYTPLDVIHTVKLIAQRVVALFLHNPDGQAAVLVRENKQGQFITNILTHPQEHGLEVDLNEYGITVYDVGGRDRRSHIPAEMLALLQWIDRPHSPDYLKAALSVLLDRRLIPSQDLNALASLPEQFLYPGPLDPSLAEPVRQAQHFCRGLLRARLELPPYQLMLFLGMALQYDQTELATTDKLAERIVQQLVGGSSLQLALDVLNDIVLSERFEPIEIEDSENHLVRPKQLTIITMHKAKGLDWDYVFIPFLHEHTLPGSLWIPPQAKFLGEFTLAEVARAQIRTYLHQQVLNPQSNREHANRDLRLSSALPTIQSAWEQAARLKMAEEYRLLYVAMTRAKRLLWMSAAQRAPFTWSLPNNLEPRRPCPLLPELRKQFPESFVVLNSALG
jgi:DNA helicase II / ATP-dependent DNA helicase PcrA